MQNLQEIGNLDEDFSPHFNLGMFGVRLLPVLTFGWILCQESVFHVKNLKIVVMYCSYEESKQDNYQFEIQQTIL